MSVSSPPVIPATQMAADAYAYLEPIADQDPDNGWVLMILCAGLGELFREVEDVARAQPGRQPYQQAYDIDQCPDWLLGWLGQFVGVPWTDYSDAAAKRQQVRAETGFYRGSVPNLMAAVIATQTPPGRASIVERTPDAWGIQVLFDPNFTPDVSALTQAAQAATAAALALTVTSTTMVTIDQAGRTIDSGTATIDTAELGDVT